MRFLTHVLCVMLSISFVLSPLSRLHAHVAGPDEQVNVHGGHSHDVGHGHSHSHDGGGHSHDGVAHEHGDASVHEHEDTGTVVSLKADQSQGGFQTWKPMHWISVLFVITLLVLAPQLISSIPRPPRSRTRPPSPYPHGLPLLRGPPVSI